MIRVSSKQLPSWVKACGAIGVSLSVLSVALYIVLDKSAGHDSKKWAYGIIGLIVGYWLR